MLFRDFEMTGNFLSRNQHGSSRYASFLSGLGTLVDIRITDQTQVFLGVLDSEVKYYVEVEDVTAPNQSIFIIWYKIKMTISELSVN